MRKTLFLSLSLIIVLCGCDGLPSLPTIPTSIKEPNVSLTSVENAGVTLSGVNLIANVEVENPNSFSLPMPKIDWELFVTDISFDTGTVEDGRSIESGEKITLPIPIHIGYDKLYGSAGSIIGSLGSGARELPYTIKMGLTFTTIPLLANRVFPVSKSGTIPLSQIPGLNLPW
ncbi:MAG: LEA type 2 family protein [Treponema sp.]|jgi:LEA14-like dessication related protein|nr:LEA type 2 family protein [Treponema sp.]